MVGCLLTATCGCIWKNETTKKCIGAADSVKRFDDDDDDDDDRDDSNETGNPYRFDSDETGALKKKCI